MKRFWTAFAAFAAAIAFAATASAGHHEAGEKKKDGHGRYFKMRDANGDGSISKDEWMAASEARFGKVDENGDGAVSPEEMRAAHKRRHEKMHGDGKGHGDH